ncbi:MAG: DUF362 domain-containing protein [Thermodesulfobacteriota bacterium]|nr:DUF362 domain-containing protein [Thermodesulfobacteriota bacterium]
MIRFRYVLGSILLGIAVTLSIISIDAGRKDIVLANAQLPNDPIGVARGIYPGRVVWAHDPRATDWDGPGVGDGHWWESKNTNLARVDRMMSWAIRSLTGEINLGIAWDKLFKYHNKAHGKSDIGYQTGEKITIKVNLVGCIAKPGWGAVDPGNYDMIRKRDYMNTSPQMMLALLRQLVNRAGIDQRDISIGDTLSYFPNEYFNLCRKAFPDVNYLDREGNFGRTRVRYSSVPFYWSSDPSPENQDFVPASYAEASYIINMANFKSHSMAAVTLCAKNHYGSLIRFPVQPGFYDMHLNLPSNKGNEGEYRPLVDLMGHAHIGGKTLLYLIDGLYAGHHPYGLAPTRLTSAPFNGGWSSSLFVSQDPVAIDSVAFDFLWSEPGWEFHTHISGGDDYLHEAALADKPESGIFYDPDHRGNVNRLSSLGVHEHWNNPTDKKYSRNLGNGDGIELISLAPVDDHAAIPWMKSF